LFATEGGEHGMLFLAHE